jgi:hypothetical protein
VSSAVAGLIILAGVTVGVIAVQQYRKGELNGKSTALVFAYITVMAAVVLVNTIPAPYSVELVNVS